MFPPKQPQPPMSPVASPYFAPREVPPPQTPLWHPLRPSAAPNSADADLAPRIGGKSIDLAPVGP